MSDLGLYLHFPFCEARCHYCDFVTAVGPTQAHERYLAAFLSEIELRARELDGAVSSVFFGGGTPSLLPAEWTARIGQALGTCYGLLPNAEFTVEANPESTTPAWLAAVREAGANRFSLGVQSFDPETLAGLDRIHSRERVAEAVRWARQAGFENLSLDLIYGWPHERAEAWRESLDAALALAPEHLSLYGLTVEERTPYARAVAGGRELAPDGDAQATQYEEAEDRLAAAGFVHYEISNWALPGRECRHNLNYWRRGEYLGLGLGAHSYLCGRRFHNTSRMADYLREAERGRFVHHDEEVLSPRQCTEEWLFLGLRLSEGLDLSEWDHAVVAEHSAEARAALEGYVASGLLHREGNRVRLTRRGRLLADEVMAGLI